MSYTIGLDIGTSSIKAALFNTENGQIAATSFFPKQEQPIISIQVGWAEQNPEEWWKNLCLAVRELIQSSGIKAQKIKAIGISYQMHGLVVVDKNRKVLRNSIIWCDSRAVEIGNRALKDLGEEKVLSECLNSPGNFTASKLRWVMENEKKLYSKIDKIMLPGDYIALKLTGEISTTASGMSEGILWNFRENKLSETIINHYEIPKSFIPDIVPTFSIQGKLTKDTALELSLEAGIPVTYRAGDQPNNAYSLNVLNPGDIAATAGTSGVIYGVTDKKQFDPQSRVNTFLHVNNSEDKQRLGVLLCINGTGILNSWLKQTLFSTNVFSYSEMNNLAKEAPLGSNGLKFFPFGNGAERVLGNKEPGAKVSQLNFNIHKIPHILRAAQEGIVFSLKYGLEIMNQTGVKPSVIKAGNTNMFLSPLFKNTLANLTGLPITLYNTDGATGAARAAAVGAGIFNSFEESFIELNLVDSIEPEFSKRDQYLEVYDKWKKELENCLNNE